VPSLLKRPLPRESLTLANDVGLGVTRLAGRGLGHKHAVKQAAHDVQGAQRGVLQEREGLTQTEGASERAG